MDKSGGLSYSASSYLPSTTLVQSLPPLILTILPLMRNPGASLRTRLVPTLRQFYTFPRLEFLATNGRVINNGISTERRKHRKEKPRTGS
jgi:hypothetical protein